VARKKKITLTQKFNKLSKIKKISFIGIFAALASVGLISIYAQNEPDYTLSVNTEQSIVSLEEEKPLIVENKNGRLNYISRGRSINLTPAGRVYCTPEDNGAITTAQLPEKTLSTVTESVEKTIESAQNPTAQNTDIGNKLNITVSGDGSTESVSATNSRSKLATQKAQAILEDVCKGARNQIPAESVPAFQSKTIVSRQTDNTAPAGLMPKVYAGGDTNTAVSSANLRLNGLSADQQVRGWITLEAIPVDAPSVVSIDFYLDDRFINSDKTSRYCLLMTKTDNTCAAYDISGIANGFHTFKAIMTYGNNQIAASSVRVNVQNPVPGLLYPDQDAEANQYWNINNARVSIGLAPLTRSNCMDTAARKWAQWMAVQDKLHHSPIATIVEAECGTGWWAILGENVGVGGNSESIFQAFMNSPGHRANILRSEYQRAGVGAFRYTKPGTNIEKLWVTQLFVRCQGSCANK
jgi:uncharacterized protein YkwD